jgi:hypothetical protein
MHSKHMPVWEWRQVHLDFALSRLGDMPNRGGIRLTFQRVSESAKRAQAHR